MDQITIIGLAAGLITTMGYVPQVIKGHRSGRMVDVSLFMPALLTVGMGLWLAYGVFLRDLPIVLWNAVSVALNVALMVMIFRYGRKIKKEKEVTR
jgi:MtN3 and saliva related transmembrane protein